MLIKKKLISIIIPVYNEQENIISLYNVLLGLLVEIKTYNYELIFVDDGSSDLSWSIISDLGLKDCHVKGISFSRNFGYQMALTAGHDYARGDAIITIDADFQDPPELIPQMIKEWENGFFIVYARRIARSDGFLKDITANLYYKLLSVVAEIMIPRNVGDFRLIDKKVVQHIRLCREPFRYWRGLVAWTGFKSTFIDFVRPERVTGETGYTWKRLIKLAFDGLTGFSHFPLEIAFYMGLFVLGTGIFMLIYIVYDVFKGAFYPLFKWLSVIVYMAMGLQFLLLWLLGKYVGTVYSQQKKRPVYIIADQVGCCNTQKIETVNEKTSFYCCAHL